MRLTFMWKDPASQQGSCPALYEAENGYVVQGTELDAATRAQLPRHGRRRGRRVRARPGPRPIARRSL